MVSGTDGPALSSASEASREGRQRPHVLFSCESAPLLSLRLKVVIRCSPRFRRCSHAKTSVHRRLWPSVQPVGAGHSEPPVKGSRLRSLEPTAERRLAFCRAARDAPRLVDVWDLFLHVPTQKPEAPSLTSEGRGGPSAGGRSSSLLPGFTLIKWPISRVTIHPSTVLIESRFSHNRYESCYMTPSRVM